MNSINLMKQYFNKEINYAEDRYNKEYEAITFTIDNKAYRSRLARKTPKKNGYFVAIWEKIANQNYPYSYDKSTDYIIINIIDDNKKGLFIFPKRVLRDKKILNYKNNAGKMAFRVYPPWSRDLNKTALKTQEWQILYYSDL